MNGIVLKNLVLLGGGHAHAHVIKMFGMNPIPGVHITLITRDVETPYSGMIPGYVAGKYTRDECHLDLEMICSWSRVTLIHAEAYDIDTVNKKVKIIDFDENKVPWSPDGHKRRRKTRPPISYDVLSIDIGITPSPYPHAFANITEGDNRVHNITPVKPIDGFAKRWDAILNRVAEQSAARLPSADGTPVPEGKPIRIALVGGGAGGCELSMVVHSRLQPYMHANMKIEVSVVSRSKTLLSGLSNPRVAAIVTRLMAEKNITVHSGSEVVDVTRELLPNGSHQCYLVDTNGKKILYDEAIWCTQVWFYHLFVPPVLLP
jgi:selenide, water dikinase